MDKKPVFYFKYNGMTIWSPNASLDVIRMGSAMIKTDIGKNQFQKLQKTNYPIGHHSNGKNMKFGETCIEGKFGLDSKYQVSRADIFVNDKHVLNWLNFDAESFIKKNKVSTKILDDQINNLPDEDQIRCFIKCIN